MPSKSTINIVKQEISLFPGINKKKDKISIFYRIPKWIRNNPDIFLAFGLQIDSGFENMSTANSLGGAKTVWGIAKHVESRELGRKKKDLKYYLPRLKWKYRKWRYKIVFIFKKFNKLLRRALRWLNKKKIPD